MRNYARVRDLETPLAIAKSLRPDKVGVSRYRYPWWVRAQWKYGNGNLRILGEIKRSRAEQPNNAVDQRGWPRQEIYQKTGRSAIRCFYEAPQPGVEEPNYWARIDKLEEVEDKAARSRKATENDIRQSRQDDSDSEDQKVPQIPEGVNAIYALKKSSYPSNQSCKRMIITAQAYKDAESKVYKTIHPLVDSGNLSGLTLIDHTLYKQLCKDEELSPTTIRLYSATSTPLDVVGRTQKAMRISMRQGNSKFNYFVKPIVVRSLNVDLLFSNRDVINMKASLTPYLSEMTIPTTKGIIKLPLIAREQGYHAKKEVARVCQTITIPRNSSQNVPLEHTTQGVEGTLFVTDDNSKIKMFAPDHRVKIVSSIDAIKQRPRKITFVRVVNHSPKPLTLQKGWDICSVTTLRDQEKETISLIQQDLQVKIT